ncbi:winged helix-turn-helix domain-containing protein [Alkalimonas delamerensis]|uniref:Winged helix-turn-helix domain-containing protein n=1 Tax=Alkalimonas delamerensis TaxID=265981 RepID=A0ABT9GT66_9GAMM|nr:winged helix-turn-helix domain-containing protein [Alkalimonas delamerensis]MDP4530163.1 winged helix-turn-helix domain-containing protein [Alkalimonas delamerensis]
MSTNLPSKLQLNDIVLDTVQQALRRGDDLIQLEPRVFDVLCYLLAHRERYVSLQELHDEVWVGRIVSDTAVRRTISKLRALLNDTDREQPKFIRSGMKRGYQWLVEPVVMAATAVGQAEPANQAEPSEQELASVDAVKSPTQSATAARTVFPLVSRKWLLASSAGVLVVLLLWLLFNGWLRTTPEPTPLAIPYEVLLDIPGRKSTLAVSHDSEQLVFTGTLDNTPGLFLLQVKTGAVQRIATAMDNVLYAAFVQQGRTIIYSAMDDSGSQLYLQQLDDLSQPPRRIESSDYIFVGHYLVLSDDQILIAAMSEPASSSYYLYHLKQDSWRPFSVSSQRDTYDISARLSPDGKQIAMLRRNAATVMAQVLLFDASSHEFLQQFPLAADFHSLEWLNDQQLLLSRVAEPTLFRFDLSSQQLDTMAIAAPWQQLQRSNSGDWFGITSPKAEPGRFYRQQQGVPARPERLFNLPDTADQLTFSQQASWYWLVEQHGQQSMLFQYHAQSGEKVQVYVALESLRVIQQQAEKLLIYLLKQERLAVLDTSSGALRYLTSAQQKVDRHQAYLTKDAVYFGEERSGRWQVSRYDLVQNQQEVLLPGYRFLAPWQQQYVARDQHGLYWLLTPDMEPLKPLPLQVPSLFPVRSMLVNDQLIAVTRQPDLSYYAYQLDLQTMQMTDIPLPPDFHALMHLSVADNQLLYRESPEGASKVVRLKGAPL